MEINSQTFFQRKRGNIIISLDSIEENAKDKYPNRSEDKKDWSFERYLESFKKQAAHNLQGRIPSRFIDAEVTEDKIKEFLSHFDCSRGLYIHGQCGTGKTHNLYGIYKRFLMFEKLYDPEMINMLGEQLSLLWERKRIIFTTVADFISDIRSNYDRENNSEQRIIDAIHQRNILFLDDFGPEKMTEWTQEIIYRLLNWRYEQMIATFFSSNLSPQELSERVGDRIVSRIIEMCDIIKLEGEDKRLIMK